jgi:hypothetical protein
MKTSKILVSNVNQLIDINGDSSNFEAEFSVVSKNREEFEAVVVNQTALDEKGTNFEFQKSVDGQFSGTIVHDNNVGENYFLILKKGLKPYECEISINKKDLPKTPKNIPEIQRQVITDTQPKEKMSFVKLLCIVLCIGIVGYIVYWFFSKKSAEKPVPKDGTTEMNRVLKDIAETKKIPLPRPQVRDNSLSSNKQVRPDIASRKALGSVNPSSSSVLKERQPRVENNLGQTRTQSDLEQRLSKLREAQKPAQKEIKPHESILSNSSSRSNKSSPPIPVKKIENPSLQKLKNINLI